ncbi:MAG: hypothetical protein QOJ01_2127 [Solirubrobacterales bacterium]|nr:hypothetical protein [Solirubrobacterales bacterium]
MLVVYLAMALIPVGAAANQVSPRYKMIYAGSGTYAVDLTSPDGLHGHVSANFQWRIAYRAAPLRNGIIEWRKGNATGSGEWSMASEADNCSHAGQLQLKGDGGGLLDLQHGVVEMLVFPEEGDFSSTDPAAAGGPCDTTDFWRQWIAGFSQIGAADYVDPLTSHFEIPKRRLKQKGGIKVLTSNRTPTFPSLVPSPSCGFTQTGECTQKFSWNATVRIKRVR